MMLLRPMSSEQMSRIPVQQPRSQKREREAKKVKKGKPNTRQINRISPKHFLSSSSKERLCSKIAGVAFDNCAVSTMRCGRLPNRRKNLTLPNSENVEKT
jgi:hypothetical protein